MMRDLDAVLTVLEGIPLWLTELEIVLTYAARADMEKQGRKLEFDTEHFYPRLNEALQAGFFGADPKTALTAVLSERELSISGTFNQVHASLVTALVRSLVRSNHTNLGLVAAQSEAMGGVEEGMTDLPVRFAHQVDAIAVRCSPVAGSPMLDRNQAVVFPMEGLTLPTNPELVPAAQTGQSWSGDPVDLPTAREDAEAEELGELLLDLAADGMFQVLQDLDVWTDDMPECFCVAPGQLRVDDFRDDAFALVLLSKALNPRR